MKYLPLVWAGLSRRWVRTLLTFFSILVAFLLFGILHGVSGGFDSLVNSMSDLRIRVQDRVSFTRWMPLAVRNRIERIPGVTAVAAVAYFGGYYEDPRNQLGADAVDMSAYFKMYPERDLPASEKQAMLNTRTGLLVGADVAKRYGWKVGESIAIGTPIWTHKNGSKAWNFQIVGIYRSKNDTPPADQVLMSYDYLNEARSGLTNMASQYIVGIAQAGSAERISQQIDALFQNSATPTLSQPEKDWVRAQIRRVGNIEFMVDAILGAVLFTLLALTANTMMQSVRERIGEFAVLKTFGFSNTSVAGLVVAEALILSLAAALGGLALAALAFPSVFRYLGVGGAPMPAEILVAGLVVAVCLALVSSVPPLWRALRLDVAAALAAH